MVEVALEIRAVVACEIVFETVFQVTEKQNGYLQSGRSGEVVARRES